MVPTPARGDNANRPQYDAYPQELHVSIPKNRHMHQDRSLLGIPAENDDYRRGLSTQCTVSIGLASSGHGSSWETMSATSYTQSPSLLDSIQHENIPAESQGFHNGTIQPQMLFNRAQSPSTQNVGASDLHWAGQQPYPEMDPAFHSLQSMQLGSSDQCDLSPDVSPASIGHPASRPLEFRSWQDPALRNQVISPIAPSSPYEPLPDFRGLQSSNPMEYPSREAEPWENARVMGAAFTSVSIDPLLATPAQALNASLRYTQDDKASSIAPALHDSKRKRSDRSAHSPRINLRKINKVREKHACLTCKLLHEEVGHL